MVLPVSAETGKELGDTATDFTLYNTDGNRVSLYDYSGKVIALNFFSTTCGGCREELPHLEKNIWRVYQSKGVQVLGISLGHSSGLQATIDTYDLTYPILLDTDLTAWNKYQATNVPLNLIIDKDMVIQYRVTGYYRESDIIAKLEELITTSVKQSIWGSIKRLFQ